MVMAFHHSYIIDRDERELLDDEDALITVARFATWKEAKKAWDETKPDPRPDVAMFFARVERSGSVTTLGCK
jgi:hypothetical protein